MVESQSINPAASKQVASLQQRHLLIGWFGLLVFLSLGIVLETMHGFKLGFYLDVQNSSRRLMWSLAHAHGTLFSLIHIAFACSVGLMQLSSTTLLSLVSKCLTGALVLMPLGFFLGGVWMYGGDPGLGVFLVPIGALLLFCGVGMVCVTLLRGRRIEKMELSGGKQATTNPQPTGEKQSRKSSRKRRKK